MAALLIVAGLLFCGWVMVRLTDASERMVLIDEEARRSAASRKAYWGEVMREFEEDVHRG